MSIEASLITALAVVLAGIATWRLLNAWLRYRGRFVITCPENMRPAGVLVDARHAASTGLGNAPQLRLSTCSRWPEKAGCGQECLSQIQDSPEDCLVRNILAKWYQGKICATCGRPFGDIEWTAAKPALLLSDRVSVDWSLVPAEQLPDTLATALPLCFACHMAATLMRQHPELATDRTGRYTFKN